MIVYMALKFYSNPPQRSINQTKISLFKKLNQKKDKNMKIAA